MSGPKIKNRIIFSLWSHETTDLEVTKIRNVERTNWNRASFHKVGSWSNVKLDFYFFLEMDIHCNGPLFLRLIHYGAASYPSNTKIRILFERQHTKTAHFFLPEKTMCHTCKKRRISTPEPSRTRLVPG